MATNDEPGFDPRFDPAFQRGFGGAPAGSGPGTGRRRSAPPAQETAQGFAPPQGYPPAQPREVRSTPPLIGEAPATPRAVASAVVVDAADADPEEQGEPRTWANPFVIALGVLAVGLVGAGLWMAQRAREPFLGTNAADQADYVTLQMLIYFAPLLVALGAATAVGVVFLLAAEWQRRRR
jgi:hypothetical protein